jgi:acetyltransferase-like isoleucine patch superfamily enzyme
MLESLVWLLPGGALKNKLLQMFGHDVARSARIGPVLVRNVGCAVIGDGATISALNVFRSLRLLQMGAGATMGSLNTVSAHPAYQALHPDVGCLIMGDGAIITSRHNVDCSGIVRIGEMSAVAGQRTTILSHEIDITVNVQTAGQVTIGDRSVVLTNCLVLKGAVLPPCSLLTAGSMLIRSRQLDPPSGIYGGSPARFVRANPAEDGESWFEREESATTTLKIDLPRRAHPTAEPASSGRRHPGPRSAWTAASAGLAVKSDRSRP